MTKKTSKEKALRLAKEYSIPIYNAEFKTANNILNEIAEHQLQMRLLDERTVFTIQGIAKRNLLKLAKKYSIPYDKDTVDYRELRDEVEYWQSLLIRAKELYIEWDKSDYNPVQFRQQIEEAEHNGFQEKQSLRSFYYEAIRLT